MDQCPIVISSRVFIYNEYNVESTQTNKYFESAQSIDWRTQEHPQRVGKSAWCIGSKELRTHHTCICQDIKVADMRAVIKHIEKEKESELDYAIAKKVHIDSIRKNSSTKLRGVRQPSKWSITPRTQCTLICWPWSNLTKNEESIILFTFYCFSHSTS